jgi:general stress protein 26
MNPTDFNPNMPRQTKFAPSVIFIVLFMLIILPWAGNAQSNQLSFPKDTLMKAALEIMKGSPFCALATIDSTGQAQVRTMNPFPLGDDMIIWFATSRKSRKVADIRNNPKVSVYYADHNNAKGYVNVVGNAVVIDDKELLVRMKRSYWESIPNWQEKFVLIKITPLKLDVANYGRGISGDPESSRTPTIVF